MNQSRLKWACRRGMLELDILLNRYVDEKYSLAHSEEQGEFENLLNCQDQDLFDWMVKRMPAPEAYQNIINLIINN